MKDVFVIDLRGNRAQGQRRSLNSPFRSKAAFQGAAAFIRQISRQCLRMSEKPFDFSLSETESRALDRRASKRKVA